MASWLSDFEFKNKSVFVKSTGVTLPLDFEIVREALAWFPFFALEKLKRIRRNLSGKPSLKITFLPHIPRPWYMLWISANRADMQIVADPDKADAIFFFEDLTLSTPPVLMPQQAKKGFNFLCADISKSRVGVVFEQVFGYALTVNPETYTGPMVVKSER
ncbi:MAG: hypothetical protein JKX72_11410, partial [Robiginitomaculum sp.]|nr:hypothetical protein [Robiginitomaculum sp.]